MSFHPPSGYVLGNAGLAAVPDVPLARVAALAAGSGHVGVAAEPSAAPLHALAVLGYETESAGILVLSGEIRRASGVLLGVGRGDKRLGLGSAEGLDEPFGVLVRRRQGTLVTLAQRS